MNVHIGNVAEFNEQFEGELPLDLYRDIRLDCDVYAGITPFLTNAPSHVVLPRDVDDSRWWDLLATRLGWEGLTVHVVDVPEDGALCDRLSMSTSLRAVVDQVAPYGSIVPWGETLQFRKLAASLPTEVTNCCERPAALAYAESKSGAADLLATAAAASPSVTVPRTRICHSSGELVEAVRVLAGSGRRLIAKSNFGVSGYGTCAIDPVWARADLIDGLLDHLTTMSHRFESWPVIVQEEVVRVRSGPADLTGDGEVLADGSVALRGNATMLVDANHYGGAVTACPSMLDNRHWEAISAYTFDVGSLLADSGYRGWFDVDFLLSVDGLLYALEINARRTGPVAAFTVATRAADLGLGRAAACRDAVDLPGRYSASEVFDVLWSLESLHCGRVVPTSFLGFDSLTPTIGLGAVGADGAEAVALLDQVIDRLGAGLLAIDRVPADSGAAGAR